ncbi:MAG: hypothetical protein A2001_19260 [Treponema sp. GWC1_61_84]|nr:MAG: hypothetical protein A2001_19260 [Treponema sp. GWC1_61_84]
MMNESVADVYRKNYIPMAVRSQILDSLDDLPFDFFQRNGISGFNDLDRLFYCPFDKPPKHVIKISGVQLFPACTIREKIFLME